MRVLDWELITGLMSAIGAIVGIVYWLGRLEGKVDRNRIDINNSRESIFQNLRARSEKELGKRDDIMRNHENAIRNTQIRVRDLEDWSEETHGYRRITTKTDFE